jgi:hypothetical protein
MMMQFASSSSSRQLSINRECTMRHRDGFRVR